MQIQREPQEEDTETEKEHARRTQTTLRFSATTIHQPKQRKFYGWKRKL